MLNQENWEHWQRELPPGLDVLDTIIVAREAILKVLLLGQPDQDQRREPSGKARRKTSSGRRHQITRDWYEPAADGIGGQREFLQRHGSQ